MVSALEFGPGQSVQWSFVAGVPVKTGQNSVRFLFFVFAWARLVLAFRKRSI